MKYKDAIGVTLLVVLASSPYWIGLLVKEVVRENVLCCQTTKTIGNVSPEESAGIKSGN